MNKYTVVGYFGNKTQVVVRVLASGGKEVESDAIKIIAFDHYGEAIRTVRKDFNLVAIFEGWPKLNCKQEEINIYPEGYE